MAEAIRAFADLDTPSVSNSLTLTARLTLAAATLASEGFQANDEVIVFAWATMNQANTATEQQWRLRYNGTTITNGTADPRIDCWGSGADTGRHVSAMCRVDLGGTIGDFTFENARVGTSANVVIERARIVVIRLADFGVENTDWFWNRSTTNVAHTTTYSATSRAAVTWTPGAVEDWVAFFQTHIAIDSVSVNAEAEMLLDGSTVVAGDWSLEGESTTEEYSHVQFGVLESLSAASHTLDVRTRDDTDTAANDHRESAIFVFRAAMWPDLFWHMPGTVSIAANNTDTQAATITDSFSVGQEALIFGCGRCDQNVLSGGHMSVENGGSTIEPNTNVGQGLDFANWVLNDTTDEPPAFWMGHDTLTSGAQDLDLIVSQGDTSARNLLLTKFLVWGMEVVSSGPDPVEVALTPATLAASAQALTVVPAAHSHALTPASLASSAQALTPVPAALAVPLTPASLALAAQALTVVPGAYSLALTPAQLAIAAQALVVDATQPVEVTLSPAGLSLAAQALTPLVGVEIALTPATIGLTASGLTVVGGPVAIALTPATLSLQAQALEPVTAVVIGLTPATIGVEAQALVAVITPISVEIQLVPATLLIEAIMPGTIHLTVRRGRPNERYRNPRYVSRRGVKLPPRWR